MEVADPYPQMGAGFAADVFRADGRGLLLLDTEGCLCEGTNPMTTQPNTPKQPTQWYQLTLTKQQVGFIRLLARFHISESTNPKAVEKSKRLLTCLSSGQFIKSYELNELNERFIRDSTEIAKRGEEVRTLSVELERVKAELAAVRQAANRFLDDNGWETTTDSAEEAWRKLDSLLDKNKMATESAAPEQEKCIWTPNSRGQYLTECKYRVYDPGRVDRLDGGEFRVRILFCPMCGGRIELKEKP